MKVIKALPLIGMLAMPFSVSAMPSDGGAIHIAQEEAASRHPLGFKEPERRLLRGYLEEAGGQSSADISGDEKEKLQPGEILPRRLVKKGEPLPGEVRSRLTNTTAGVTELQFDNRLVRLWEASRQVIDVLRSPDRDGS